MIKANALQIAKDLGNNEFKASGYIHLSKGII
jgi:hypothetical protein